jgi:hypothetical protein
MSPHLLFISVYVLHALILLFVQAFEQRNYLFGPTHIALTEGSFYVPIRTPSLYPIANQCRLELPDVSPPNAHVLCNSAKSLGETFTPYYELHTSKQAQSARH